VQEAITNRKLIYTLITGACKGIGKAIAYACASRGLNLLLVSNDSGCLEAVCNEIKSKGLACECLALDLTEDSAPLQLYQWVIDNKFKVNMLVNNVGIGKGGTFASMDISDMQYMMKLNNNVLVELTYRLLPELKKHPQSFILNLSSLEAQLPLPYKAVYTGTKNFVYAFSLAIAEELKFANVQVSVLCPGPVLTNTEGLMRMNAHGGRSKILMMYPDQVAQIALNGLFKRKRVIVPGFINTICFKIGGLLPVNVKMNLLERLFRVYKTS
jgi:short-subunit dehydrogenase